MMACGPQGSERAEETGLPGANAGPTPQRSFEEVFTGHRSIVLEENEDVIKVSPTFTPHPGGGFLVADSREHRIRRYSETGDLLWQFGRSGPGPEEFGGLLRNALQIPDGRIMIAELSRKVMLLDEEAPEVSAVFPIFTEGMIEELDLLPDGRVLAGCGSTHGSRRSSGCPMAAS
jgi:hypothetical protein